MLSKIPNRSGGTSTRASRAISLQGAGANAPALAEADLLVIARRAAAAPLRWSADTLAWRLGLTIAVHMALGITTIGRAKSMRSVEYPIAVSAAVLLPDERNL